MNDEWKMPGTEQEENQQPVGEESEVTEATAVKEPEAGETAEAMPEATESQEPEVSERVEVTETTEEVATNGDGQVAKTEEEKPRYPWEAVLGKEEKKEQPADVTDTRYSHRNSRCSRVVHSRRIREKQLLITG